MGQYYDHIPGFLIPWINAQKIFWVATAPLSESGHVNVSPKGFERTMNVVLDESEDGQQLEAGPDGDDDRLRKATSSHVWYEDLTGSGVETISHIRENGRITVLFTAFEGPPRIMRLFGTGKVYEFGTPEYDTLLPPEKRQPGSRAVIWVDVHKVGTSCGYSIPFFTYKSPRVRLHNFAINKEQQDFDYACQQSESSSVSDSSIVVVPEQGSTVLSHSTSSSSPSLPPDNQGLKNYWKLRNLKSQDGLPGLLFAYTSPKVLGDWRGRGISFKPDDETTGSKTPADARRDRGLVAIFASEKVVADVGKVLVGFGAGVLVTTVFARLWAK
ncbi:hypothetical protein EST38_g7362 [Candolleomyces aberdarensis]|uniref:Pyridoxamine 5'-phosphate oxidase putative domain-containing protein n=1 Tax=Candolleomyces aberdarensis TaxID=2316362 RepID=A0A4Q2DFA7_9AGAR|nr:hypothetical protein EST38_g7362 [Candolleomyces aberdarensis]